MYTAVPYRSSQFGLQWVCANCLFHLWDEEMTNFDGVIKKRTNKMPLHGNKLSQRHICQKYTICGWARKIYSKWICNSMFSISVVRGIPIMVVILHSPRLYNARDAWYARSRHSNLFAHLFAWLINYAIMLFTHTHECERMRTKKEIHTQYAPNAS